MSEPGTLQERHIALIGLSGAGKTSTGRQLAALLKRRFVDTDDLIEEQAGRSIPELFSSLGEPGFRDLETQALQAAVSGSPAVIATGGGIALREANRSLLRRTCWTAWLTAEPAELLQRLQHDATERPLLRADPAARLAALRAEREPLYAALADRVVQTDRRSSAAVAQEVLRGWQQWSPESLWVTSSSGSYEVLVAPGAFALLPGRLQGLGLRGRCWLVSDDQVGPLYGPQVQETLQAAGYQVQSLLLASGEQSKSLAQAEALYDWLLAGGVERGDVLLALGGGVIGDLGGFVASTILRGVQLVQLPTTVLAMVDSSIGGKTGVNHRRGKNLVGTFYPPRLVLADTMTLRSLPRRELSNGLAEAIKHGIIADAELFADMERSIEALLRLEEPLTSALIRRASAVKVGVVSADERESGLRLLLNYGHTLGHAIEAAMGYGPLLHGEAVAIGMELAAAIALRLGRFSPQEAQRQRALLHAAGLPTQLPAGLTLEAVLGPVSLDKKRQSGAVRWVLPEHIGRAIVSRDVPLELVQAVVQAALG